ncbi:MAG: lysine--tRNA ligase [Candidatus Limnocylindria bacterium]
MFWADEIAAQVVGPEVVGDSKTPSGTIHVGSLRGVVIHDSIVRALVDAGREVRFVYGVDDMDPMDAATLASREGLTEHMGRPLKDVPAPAGSPHASWARHFGQTFLATFERLGIHPDFYWASELYASGAVDDSIRIALDRAADIRRVYREVSHSVKPDDWHPLSVVCESCGRIGTTYVDGWDGEQVSYRCLPDLVSWARGCGHAGRVTPFGGRAKLPWNVDWVAKWRQFAVKIEGCGKDLSTAGGSRERSDAIARQVFGLEPPLNVPYEFFNVGGRKMKSSAGTGTTAEAMVAALPPEIVRFLMLRHRPQQTIEFDPSGETVPRLFDEYDAFVAVAAGADAVRGHEAGDPAQARRIVEMSQLPAQPVPAYFLPPFAQVATYVQMPGADVAAAIGRHRGAPLDGDANAELQRRTAVAERWLREWAPDRYRFAVSESLPDAVQFLDPDQAGVLARLADRLEVARDWEPDALQAAIFESAAAAGVPAVRAFAAVYAAFLGKTGGPRAGSLLGSLTQRFVVERLRSAAGSAAGVAT